MVGKLLQVRVHVVADPAAGQEFGLGGIDDVVEGRSHIGSDGANSQLIVRAEQRDGLVETWGLLYKRVMRPSSRNVGLGCSG
jgi:hypothetical protein